MSTLIDDVESLILGCLVGKVGRRVPNSFKIDGHPGDFIVDDWSSKFMEMTVVKHDDAQRLRTLREAVESKLAAPTAFQEPYGPLKIFRPRPGVESYVKFAT